MQNPEPNSIVEMVSSARLKQTVSKLASWPNRNTNNATLVEVADWLAHEFDKLIPIEVSRLIYDIAPSSRIPEAKSVMQILAILPGKTDRIVMVGAHFDSLNNSDFANLEAHAPGANDDASGIALVLESARILVESGIEFEQTLCFVAFSGEEQGLLGSKSLSQKAKEEDWKIEALFSNDMVGNSSNLICGQKSQQVRVFSEESLSHQSRELARFVEWNQRSASGSFGIKLVLRADRFARGGDHSPFNANGFSAIRFTEEFEEYSRQHTVDDLPEHVDEEYLAEVTRANLRSLLLLAKAKEAPTEVKIGRAQGYNTELEWIGNLDQEYDVFWRDSRSAIWENCKRITGLYVKLVGVYKDDSIFAVAAVGGIPVVAN